MSVPVDAEGYLVDLSDWSETVAGELAGASDINLTPAHWEIVHALRAFYSRFERAPSMRPLVNWIREELGAKKGTSVYVMTLFGGATEPGGGPPSPAKAAARIAGLPRPTHCL